MHHRCNLQYWTLFCWRCLFAAGLFQKQFSKTSSSDPPSMNSTQGIIWSILSIDSFFSKCIKGEHFCFGFASRHDEGVFFWCLEKTFTYDLWNLPEPKWKNADEGTPIAFFHQFQINSITTTLLLQLGLNSNIVIFFKRSKFY